MRRREVIAGLLLAAMAEPTNAQQRSKLPLVGLLDPGIPHLFDAFRDGMRILGHFENQNITFVHRSADGRPEPIPGLTAELVRLNVDVIVTAGTSTVRAAAQATSNIPIVFAALGDAVRTGIVDTLARPGANLTGLSFLNTEISPKRLEFWPRLSPACVRSGFLLSYGPILADLHTRSAVYVDKILKGAKPADLPVEQAERFKLVINLKTAAALGLTIPPTLLTRADEVIE